MFSSLIRKPLFLVSLIAATAIAFLMIGGAIGFALSSDRILMRLFEMKADYDASRDADVVQTEKETALSRIRFTKVRVGDFSGGGGALVEVDGRLIFTTPKGKLGVLDARSNDFALSYGGPDIPMNVEEMDASDYAKSPLFTRRFVRALGFLTAAKGDGRYDLYASHHAFNGSCIDFKISKIEVIATATAIEFANADWQTVYTAVPCIAYKTSDNLFQGEEAGGAMVQIAPGRLLVTIGDHGIDGDKPGEIKVSMDPTSHLGKVIEIDLATGDAEIYASGLRNPQGMIASRDGRVWLTEHGPQGGDEINIVKRDANYGWPEVTLGSDYADPGRQLARRPWPFNPVQGRHDGFEKPVFSFVPSPAISPLTEIDGNEFPLWKDDLLVGSLRSQTLFRLRRNDDRILYAEPIEVRERIRDLITMEDGRIAMLTDSARIQIISNGDEAGEPAPISLSGLEGAPKEKSRISADASNVEIGEITYELRCASCHSLSGEPLPGPPLNGVVRRDIASVEGYPYSDALTNMSGRWSKKRLREFINDVDATAPGTTMQHLPEGHEYSRAVVDYLATVK